MTSINRIQPEGLVKVQGFGFSQVVASEAKRYVHISGQVAVDAQGAPVGVGDLEAQTRQVMENLKLALEAADATFEDVVKLNIYVVDYDPAQRGMMLAVRNEYIDPFNAPASTLVGVPCLVSPDFLIEIEATAALN